MFKKSVKIIILFLAVIGAFVIISAVIIVYSSKVNTYKNPTENLDYKFTGEELFDAVNEYRVSQGITTLKIEDPLCNNIVERYETIKQNDNSHEGFTEWQKSIGINDKYKKFGEIYIKQAKTTKEAIDWWNSSPSHKVILNMEEFIYGCSYAYSGVGVVVMSAEKK